MKTFMWVVHEMRLQMKNGMYLLYIGVACFYILLMSYIPADYKSFSLAFIIFSDPTFLGMFFVGSIFLLEKQQGIPKVIGITPLGVRRYLLGKVMSLLAISIVVSVIIAVASGFTNILWMKLIGGIILSGSLFTLVGTIVGTVVKNTNQFLIVIGVGCMVLALPLVDYYEIWDMKLFNFIPTYSAMALIEESIRKDGSLQDIIHSIYLILWNVVALECAVRMIEEKVLRG